MRTAYYTDAHQHQIARVIPDLVRYRQVLWDLVSKDLRVRYRNAVMGVLWAVLQPLLTTLILTFVFTVVIRIGGTARDSAPVILCGVIPWRFLSSALTTGSNSLVKNESLIKKVYFPREIIPVASVLAGVVDMVIGFVLLILLQICLGNPVGWTLIWVPVIFGIQLALTVGLTLVFACLNVFYRDVIYLMEVALTFGFYATPVFYRLEDLEGFADHYPYLFGLYALNPMVGLITAYRTAVLRCAAPAASDLVLPLLVSALVAWVGVVVFRRKAAVLADYL